MAREELGRSAPLEAEPMVKVVMDVIKVALVAAAGMAVAEDHGMQLVVAQDM